MTTKEKAQQLVERFEGNVKYALIAVDEVLLALKDYGDSSYELQNMDREFNFWQEVKQEIEKL
jgi:hypothetical protein